MVRLVGICNRDPETVILAHFRLIGASGMGLKIPDVIGAWCCAACHSYVDSHKDDETQLSFARGVFRTQLELLKQGAIQA